MGELITFLLGALVVAIAIFNVFRGNFIEVLSKIIVGNTHVHSWGKWEKKSAKMYKVMSGVKIPGSDFVQMYQERKCKTCGKTEHEELQY